MKIAMISDALMVGGAERQMLLGAVELAKLGHTVKVITYYPYVEFQDFIRQNNVDFVRIKRKGFLRIGRIRALAGCLREGDFDVVHAFKGTVSIFSSLAAKLAGIKLVFGGFRSVYNERRVFRLAHRAVNRLLTGWIVNSKAVADSMVANLGIEPEKVSVVHNGVTPEAFKSKLSKNAAKQKLGLSEDQPVVTEVARLEPVKNHQLFIKMASIILRRRPDVRFLIAGDGPLRSDMEDYTKSLGVCDSVLFIGTRSDIPDVLAATDVSVLTSDHEGFPNALIEAMCVGIPVVSTDYLSIYELIVDGKHGFIVPRNDAEAMAAKVTQLLDGIDLRKRMGQEGMKMVQERLSPSTMAKNLVAVYEKCMTNRK